MTKPRLSPLCFGLALLPPLGTGLLAILWFLPLPIYDYWDVLVHAWQVKGQPAAYLHMLWAPCADQRMVWPRLFISQLSYLTSNQQLPLEIAWGFLAQSLIALMLTSMVRRTAGLPWRRHGLWALLITALLFWPYLLYFRFLHHWYSTQYSLVMLPGVAAIWLFQGHQGPRTLPLIALCALISATSHGTGLFLLLAFIPFLILDPRTARWKSATWTIVSLSFIAFLATQLPPRESLGLPPLTSALRHPGNVLKFIPRCFAPKVNQDFLGPFMLLLGLLSTVTLIRRRPRWRMAFSPWLLLFLWSLLVAAGSATGRAKTGHTNPVYFTFFVLPWISIAVLTATALKSTRKAQPWLSRLLGALAIYLLVVWALGSLKGIKHARKQHEAILECQQRLRFYPLLSQPDIQTLFPHPRIIPHLQFLQNQGAHIPGLDQRPFNKQLERSFNVEFQSNAFC